MATDINRLKQKIKTTLGEYDNISPEAKESARDDFAQKLADAIVFEIKALAIQYTSGLSAGPNTVVGIFNCIIS